MKILVSSHLCTVSFFNRYYILPHGCYTFYHHCQTCLELKSYYLIYFKCWEQGCPVVTPDLMNHMRPDLSLFRCFLVTGCVTAAWHTDGGWHGAYCGGAIGVLQFSGKASFHLYAPKEWWKRRHYIIIIIIHCHNHKTEKTTQPWYILFSNIFHMCFSPLVLLNHVLSLCWKHKPSSVSHSC